MDPTPKILRVNVARDSARIRDHFICAASGASIGSLYDCPAKETPVVVFQSPDPKETEERSPVFMGMVER